jgi:hypothetical protein
VTGVTGAGVHEGDVLAGKYRVERVLGVGGMGVVVAAHHLELDQRVAIKFLHPEAVGYGDAVARFAREARAAVKIKSEHVAKVTDVGKLEDGAPYMVMEYLEGSDLAGWLAKHGALSSEQAVEFVLQACEAIAEAHMLGIVHRDLKPSNLFLIRRPEGAWSVKVLDFGISKMTSALGTNGGSMTRTSALLGSPYYMSPEQMQSARDVDARSDIWALGVILYELLSGGPPFVADTMPELVLRVVNGGPPAPLRSLAPETPEGLDAAIRRCLERDRSARYANVGELAVALAPFAPKRARISVERISGIMGPGGFSGALTAQPPSSDGVLRPTDTATAGIWGKTISPRARGGLLVAGTAALALAAGALVWRTHADSSAGMNATSARVPSEPVASIAAAAQPALPQPPPPPPLATPIVSVPVATEAPATAPVASASAAPPGTGGKPSAPRVNSPVRLTKGPLPTAPRSEPVPVPTLAPAPPVASGRSAPVAAPAPRVPADQSTIFDERK